MARRLVLPLAILLAAFCVLIGLGTWQLERLRWKEGLIATVAARADAPPSSLPPAADWPRLTRAQDEYRHVRVTGSFDHGRETLVYAVKGEDTPGLRGQGYFVVTPLLRKEGPPVLVNRGFVPADRRDPSSRAAGQIEGEVTVAGLIRFPEEASAFVPANDPARNAFYRRDPVEIAAARGLQDAAPFIIDADAAAVPGGLPEGGATRRTFPNRHLEYALTWYGLAAALVGVAVAWLFTQSRKMRGDQRPARGS